MGDHMQVDKPEYVASHLGQLSLLPSVGWQNKCQLLGSWRWWV